MKKLFLLIFIAGCLPRVSAATVDTVLIYSAAMHKEFPCVIIRPDAYQKKKNHFPVVYLLHGYDGNYANWIKKAPELTAYADTYQLIIVCPDGAKSSWYFDSPIDSTYRYETYISAEVVQYVDSHFHTIADKEHRAITGLSMGGHGALFLALRHPGIFGAAGSMSGGVDLRESHNRFEISKRIGDTLTHEAAWHDNSVVYLVENYPSTPVKMIFDCGVDDFFIDGNRHLHQTLLRMKIPHEYSEKPGGHSWAYWKSSLPFHLLYFSRFFAATSPGK
ncbi:MAG: alpha/beta hydrolase family protein [Ferruginibacter sp.]